MRDADLAWAAGFLEGEGCFGFYGGKRSRGGMRTAALLVSACQNQSEPLERLQNIFGGVISHSASRYEWRLNGHAAAPAMEALLPEMSERRQNAILEALKRHYDKQAELEARRDSPVCPRGHSWSEHAGQIKKGARAGQRYCKACARDRAARRREVAL